jgi:transcriptional regulator NrdR family protein
MGRLGRTRRRRICKGCGERFTTVEIPVEEFEALQSESARLVELGALIRGNTDGQEEKA